MRAAVGQPGGISQEIRVMEFESGYKTEQRPNQQPDRGADEHYEERQTAGGVNLRRCGELRGSGLR